jgi:methyl-accepting chemotaxis protein
MCSAAWWPRRADLNHVILRFIKWDMDGAVPHAARTDEVGEIAKALKAFQADAIKWSESHKSEQDSQVQGRLASQQRTEELIHQFRGSIAGILGAFADSARTETARALSTVASDTNERVGVVAAASDEASANVQTVAKSSPSRWARSARASPRQAASSIRSPRTPAPPISRWRGAPPPRSGSATS